MADRIQFRRDTEANWAKENPLLLEGEEGIILDNPGLYKIGDGERKWNDLPILGVSGSSIPDEEDLTLREKDGKLVLKLKDRNISKGKGYIILRTEKTLAEQMVQENTIYEVRYDFDLGGETLEVPANCSIYFNGGKLINGTIVGNKTSIEGNDTSIFYNITMSGTFDVEGINVEWFRTSSLSDSDIINIAINNAVSTKAYQVFLAPIQYDIDNPITIKVKIALNGVFNGTRLNATNENIMITWSGLTDFCEISNIYFCGYGGKAIFNTFYDYASTFHIHDCQFDAELEYCIRGNFILSTIDKCMFGYYGTAHPNHSHIIFKGNTEGNVANANKISDCRMYRSTSDYGCSFEGGFELLITRCNFEQCNNKKSVVRFAGFNTFEVTHCWFEHCKGDCVITLANNTEGFVYGNYTTDLNHNYFYMNDANKYVIFVGGASYNVHFVFNHVNNITGKQISYDGISYNTGILTYYENRLLPYHSGINNFFNLSSPSVSSKGLIADPWFKTWDVNRLNGWNKSGITAWEKYPNTELGEQYEGGVRFWNSTSDNNCMYISLPLFLVKGKTIKIEAIYKEVQGAEGGAFQIGYSFTSANPTWLENIGSYMQSKEFAKVSATVKVPSDAAFCTVGIISPGSSIVFVLKAFDVFVVDGKISPTISNDILVADKTIKLTSPKVGDYYFNVSQGKPLFWNGTQWVDSTGVALALEE